MTSRSHTNTTYSNRTTYNPTRPVRRYRFSKPVTKRSLHYTKAFVADQGVFAKIRRQVASALPPKKAIQYRLAYNQKRNRGKNPSQPSTSKQTGVNPYLTLYEPQTLVGDAPRAKQARSNKNLSVCEKRDMRKQIIHALGKAGGKVGKPRFTPESMISC